MTEYNLVNQWVANPVLLQHAEQEALDRLVADFPSFGLARLMAHYKQNGLIGNPQLKELLAYNPTIFALWEQDIWKLAKHTEQKEEAEVNDINGIDFPLDTTRLDYFTQQGIKVASEIPEEMDASAIKQSDEKSEEEGEEDKSLMVVMSFTEWLQFLQQKTRKEEEEVQEKRALKAMWQKQKMAEAIEEENDEIPASVFEMAVNSIQREEGIVSEAMATVYARQGKTQQAIDMYQKLSLQNPDKSAYFAQLIEALEK